MNSANDVIKAWTEDVATHMVRRENSRQARNHRMKLRNSRAQQQLGDIPWNIQRPKRKRSNSPDLAIKIYNQAKIMGQPESPRKGPGRPKKTSLPHDD